MTHTIIGRLSTLTGFADAWASDLQGKAIDAELLGILVPALPDGVIFQDGPACSITQGARLIPFDPTRTDWTNCKRTIPAPEMTRALAADFVRWMLRECKAFGEQVAMQGGSYAKA